MVETMGTLRLDLARFTLLASAVGFSLYQEDNFDSPVNKVQFCWSFSHPPILTLEFLTPLKSARAAPKIWKKG